MKLAIYGEGKVNQIVLTPENDWEKRIVDDCKEGKLVTVRKGGFYHCQGGWDRHDQDQDQEALIIRFEDVKDCKHLKIRDDFDLKSGLTKRICADCNTEVFTVGPFKNA